MTICNNPCDYGGYENCSAPCALEAGHEDECRCAYHQDIASMQTLPNAGPVLGEVAQPGGLDLEGLE